MSNLNIKNNFFRLFSLFLTGVFLTTCLVAKPTLQIPPHSQTLSVQSIFTFPSWSAPELLFQELLRSPKLEELDKTKHPNNWKSSIVEDEAQPLSDEIKTTLQEAKTQFHSKHGTRLADIRSLSLMLKVIIDQKNDHFRRYSFKDLERLLETAMTVPLFLNKEYATVHFKGPFGHTRRGISKDRHGNIRPPTIWLGAKLFEYPEITDEDLALLLLEESQHIVFPDRDHGDGKEEIGHSRYLHEKLEDLRLDLEREETHTRVGKKMAHATSLVLLYLAVFSFALFGNLMTWNENPQQIVSYVLSFVIPNKNSEPQSKKRSGFIKPGLNLISIEETALMSTDDEENKGLLTRIFARKEESAFEDEEDGDTLEENKKKKRSGEKDDEDGKEEAVDKERRSLLFGWMKPSQNNDTPSSPRNTADIPELTEDLTDLKMERGEFIFLIALFLALLSPIVALLVRLQIGFPEDKKKSSKPKNKSGIETVEPYVLNRKSWEVNNELLRSKEFNAIKNNLRTLLEQKLRGFKPDYHSMPGSWFDVNKVIKETLKEKLSRLRLVDCYKIYLFLEFLEKKENKQSILDELIRDANDHEHEATGILKWNKNSISMHPIPNYKGFGSNKRASFPKNFDYDRLLATYHSHDNGTSMPSDSDILFATGNGTSNFVFSSTGDGKFRLKLFVEYDHRGYGVWGLLGVNLTPVIIDLGTYDIKEDAPGFFDAAPHAERNEELLEEIRRGNIFTVYLDETDDPSSSEPNRSPHIGSRFDISPARQHLFEQAV